MNESFVLGFFAVFVTWLLVSVWVVVDRVLHDRLVARFRTGETGRRLPWRAVARLVADSSDADLAAALSRYVLESDEQRVLAIAQDHRAGWKRIEAARILARSGHPLALKVVENILADGDEDVRAAALTIISEVEGKEATALLIETLRSGVCPPRWASALLDRRVVSAPLLLELVGDPRVAVRAIATQLLGKVDFPNASVEEALFDLCDDPEADVRAAACRGLGERGGLRAAEKLEQLLSDPVWFVQIRAARALGRLDSVSRAGKIAELLASPRWWVRQAAKDALVDLGPDVLDQLTPFLDHVDPFARNSCAEVLQNVGVVGSLLAKANDTSNPKRAANAAALLRKILDAGGSRVEQATLGRPAVLAPQPTRERPARPAAAAHPEKRRVA